MTQRPVIPGFHPDPSVCWVDGWYYLANSSFEYAPGVPLFRSRDLSGWEPIGHALDRRELLGVDGCVPSGGVFAPTLRHHDGRFWMITTNWHDEGGQIIVSAEDPAGEWSGLIRLPELIGIDPDLTWGPDGTCYLTYSAFGDNGQLGITQVIIDLERGEVVSEPRRLWSGTGGKAPEGPHLYEVDGTWYLLIAEGGTERGHAVTIARGPSPEGPFEGNPDNPIITRRGIQHSVQSTGHADLVHGPDGGWAIVYHGTRPRGSSPEWHVLGRETFADRVEWVDGWPRLADHIEPAPSSEVVEERAVLPLPDSWVGSAVWPTEVVSGTDRGWSVSAGEHEVFVGRRQEHEQASARARLRVDGSGGLELRIDPTHRVRLTLQGDAVAAEVQIGPLRQVLGTARLHAGDELVIRCVEFVGSFWLGRGPDRVELGVERDGELHLLGDLDGRYLSTEVAGGMTGRMFGVVADPGSVVEVLDLVYAGRPVESSHG